MNYKNLFLLIIIGVSLPAWANKTPSDVYQVTEQIVLEVQYLRDKMGANGTPRIPGVQVYKTPLHVFAKSLEVLEKIAKIQETSGLTSQSIQHIPLKPVSPDDAFLQVEKILQQIKSIQGSKNISSSGNNAPFVDGKTPSNVYENLWKISFMLDALVKKIKPTDVYNNMQSAMIEINDVADYSNVNLSSQIPLTDKKTKPYQVLLQGYINLHKIAELEKKLGLKPFRVPSFPKGKISPSDVYDSASMLVAEVTRIKIHLKISERSVVTKSKEKKIPSDVLAIMLMTEKNINALISAQ